MARLATSSNARPSRRAVSELVGEVDGAAGEKLNEVRPPGCLRLDPRDAAFSPKAGVETRAAFCVLCVNRGELQGIGEEETRFVIGESRYLDGLDADEIRRPCGILQHRDRMGACENPDEPAVALD